MNGTAFPMRAVQRKGEAVTFKRGCSRGFTLAELLVSVFVLVIIILMVAQLMSNATAITRTGNKHITTDTQARAVFDRMAVDLAQMLKRTDIDYYVKGPTSIYHGHGNGHGWGNRRQTGQQGSDQIAFFSQVPGYYPTGSASPISLVAYRIYEGGNTNPAYLKLQRLGKGLLWNGVSNPAQPPNNSQYTSPMVFLPLLINDRWPAATSGSTANDDYETIGAGVFRFEYYYLLKSGQLNDTPWDIFARPNQTTLTNPEKIGLTDIEAIVVAIAVIDSASRALIDAASPTGLDEIGSDMADFRSARGRGFGGTKNIGDLEYSWYATLVGDANQGLPGIINTGQTSAGSPVPPEAAKAIRIYSKTFDLRGL
jgi:Prokaryotic N-terminal methylation motif